MAVRILLALILCLSIAEAQSSNGRTYLQMTRKYYEAYYSDRQFHESDADPDVGLVVYLTYEKVPDTGVCNVAECFEITDSDAAEVKYEGVLKDAVEAERVDDAEAVDAAMVEVTAEAEAEVR